MVPGPGSTAAVLKALADECLKATFFEIGKHATWHPEITKQVIDPGMTVCTHTWSHKDLARNHYAKNSRDFKMRKPDQVIKSVMSQLEKHGKGMILMHDFHRNTAEALPELLHQLKAGGYKVVHMVPKGRLTTVPKDDEMVSHQDKLSSNNTRPEKASFAPSIDNVRSLAGSIAISPHYHADVSAPYSLLTVALR